MKGWGFAAAAAAWVAGCGTSDSARVERTGSAASEIQAGTTDSTHSFVVGVVQVTSSTIEFCTGALLAPNLVATARHCVSQISSSQIDCATSTFGALDSTSTLYVTTDAVITQRSTFVPVAANGIKVPGPTAVCGNDIALLILSQSITLPGGYPAGYVVPAISPPLTDPSRSTKITAIGYGIDSPTDDAGVTAGTRRIKENVSLTCIPGDTGFADCFSDPLASQYMTTQEFISGDQTTCEGDSGSGVFDQTQFDAGKWVSYGVLSRGSVSADGQNCVQPIYTRFDKYGPLLSQAAVVAAGMGGYALPAWATSTSTGGADAGSSPADAGTTADAGSTSNASSGAAGGSSSGASSGSAGSIASLGPDGAACNYDSDCASGSCVAFDNVHFYCASVCQTGGTCADGFLCKGPASGNYCFPSSAASSGRSGSSGGCSVASVGPASPREQSPAFWLLGAGCTILIVRTGRRAGGARRARA